MSYISHEDYKNLMSQFQKETPKGILKEALHPVGEEDSDIDNDGDTDKTDKYLLKRRAAIGKAIGKGRMMKEDEVEEGYADRYAGSEKLDNIFKENVHGGHPIPPGDIKSIGKNTYSIKRPDGKEVSVSFNDYEIEDIVDPPYGAIGTVMGRDEDGNEYRMEANFVAAGYDDWEKEPDHGSLEVYMNPPNNEGLHMPPLQATGPTISTVEEDHMETPFSLPKRKDTSKLDYDPDASRFEPDYMKAPGEDDDDEDEFEFDDEEDIISASDDIPTSFKKAVAGDRNRYPFLRENTDANPPFGFDVLSPDERKQLKEYIESVKTIKKEIAKLAAKAGKKVKVEGGNMTGLTMTPSVTSEGASHEKIEKIEKKIPEKLYAASEKVIKHLQKAGLTGQEIKMFLNHEIEEVGKEALMAQHDLEEMYTPKNPPPGTQMIKIPAQGLKAGDIMTGTLEKVVNVWPGAREMSGKLNMGKVTVELEKLDKDLQPTGKKRVAAWGKHTEIGAYRPE